MGFVKTFYSRIKPGSHEVVQPTYQQDIVGEVQQWDERDIVFSRSDLYNTYGEGSSEFHAYYALHPEWLDIDTKTNRMPGLGRTGDGDSPMMAAQFAAIQTLRHFGSMEINESTPIGITDPERSAPQLSAGGLTVSARKPRVRNCSAEKIIG